MISIFNGRERTLGGASGLPYTVEPYTVEPYTVEPYTENHYTNNHTTERT